MDKTLIASCAVLGGAIIGVIFFAIYYGVVVGGLGWLGGAELDDRVASDLGGRAAVYASTFGLFLSACIGISAAEKMVGATALLVLPVLVAVGLCVLAVVIFISNDGSWSTMFAGTGGIGIFLLIGGAIALATGIGNRIAAWK